MGDFFTELKRRHIYRVAAAYVVVAWVVIQVVSNLSPLLKLPDWMGPAVIVLLAIGFPVALLFAWIHQLPEAEAARPQGGNSLLDWGLMAALIVVIGLVSYAQLAPRGQAKAPTVAADPAAAQGISIAVLPFANMSGDASQEFFSDGMTEEINAALTKVPDLHVVARTSAFEFKGQNGNARAVGEALNATHLIEGSVRKAGNRVRITAQLVRADNGINLWSENYDRDLTDIFAIQEDIAQAIAAALKVPLGLQRGDTLVGTPTKNEIVYEDYLRAKASVRTRSGGGLQRLIDATTLLESVIARDPMFASAHALLAYTYAVMPTFEPPFLNGDIEKARPIIAELLQKAEVAANRAVELDPGNADSHVALASVEYARGHYIGASDQFVRALELDSGNPDGLHVYSGMLADLGYLGQAVRMRERLQSLEPLVGIYQVVSSRILLTTGQTDAALAMLGQYNSPIAVAPIYAFQGRYADAAETLSSTQIEGTRDQMDAARQLLRSAPMPAAAPDRLPNVGVFFFVYPYVGAASRALEWPEGNLKTGYRAGTSNVLFWGRDFAALRKTERFKAFVRNAGMFDFWKAKGFPDLCHPLGPGDFVCD